MIESMSQSFPGQGAPDDPLADVPLLREIQRVLLSSSGPVNWELARQVGIASSVGATVDVVEPSDEDRASLEGAVRMAELAVADLTGLDAPPEVAAVEPVRRARWVEANVGGLAGMFEPGAERLARALAEARRAEAAEAPEGMQMFEALLDRMAPLLMGAQVGMSLGYLAQRALGQYDLPLPRTNQRALLFVIPNLAALERDWSLPSDQLRAWVALHEVAHAFQLGRPWVRDHFIGMAREIAEAVEFDLTGLQERLERLDISDPSRVADALGADLLTGALTEEQQLLLRRVQAFMAAAEGHADHVTSGLGRKLLPEHARIEEAMRRRHDERGEEDRAAERLLGIEVDSEHYRLGRDFCARVVELTNDRTLARMWGSAEALPSMPELEEPRLWLARMA